MFYSGHDGRPYSWVFGNDVNGDNLSNISAGGDLATSRWSTTRW